MLQKLPIISKIVQIKIVENWISYKKSLPYGQKFSKSAHHRRVFYAISADFDADKRKKRQFYDNFKNPM